MPNTGAERPKEPLPVLVQDEHRATMWGYGLLLEWRWVDEPTGLWEGRVARSAQNYEWIPGTRLRRVGSAASQAAKRYTNL